MSAGLCGLCTGCSATLWRTAPSEATAPGRRVAEAAAEKADTGCALHGVIVCGVCCGGVGGAQGEGGDLYG
jgi:hypothetical protein